jgi:hypothetical protein
VSRRGDDFQSQQKRPISLREWARPFGFTSLVLAYIALIEAQWRYVLGLLTAGVLLLVWRWYAPRDPRFARDFPYLYVGDLPPDWSPTAAADRLSTGTRTSIAAGLAAAVMAAWASFDATPSGLTAAAAAATLIGIWAYEIPHKPARWIVTSSLLVGASAATVFCLLGFLIGLFLRSDGPSLVSAFLDAAVVVGSSVFIGLSLYAAGSRYPARLLGR